MRNIKKNVILCRVYIHTYLPFDVNLGHDQRNIPLFIDSFGTLLATYRGNHFPLSLICLLRIFICKNVIEIAKSLMLAVDAKFMDVFGWETR
jgi:hypothetical protein